MGFQRSAWCCLSVLLLLMASMSRANATTANLRRKKRVLQGLGPHLFGEDLSFGGKLTSHPNADATRAELFSLFEFPETETFESFPVNTKFPFSSTAFSRIGNAELSAAGDATARVSDEELYGRSAVSGANFLDVDANEGFVLTLEKPASGFGFYAVDVGDNAGTLNIQTSLNGGELKQYTVPHTNGVGIGPNGSDKAVIYVGLVDLEEFDTIVFDLKQGTSSLPDFFSFDDFSVFHITQFIGEFPSRQPSATPSQTPTIPPTTLLPTTNVPSLAPSNLPSTLSPTIAPTGIPTAGPSTLPTTSPSTKSPTSTPTDVPSSPSNSPTIIPTTSFPTTVPTEVPTTSSSSAPTVVVTTSVPTSTPTIAPNASPSISPTNEATTAAPSDVPNGRPTNLPTTFSPTEFPTQIPIASPTNVPTFASTTASPTLVPTVAQTITPPTILPSIITTDLPSTLFPTLVVTVSPTTNVPTKNPSSLPTTTFPTTSPTTSPALVPTRPPIDIPTPIPSEAITTSQPVEIQFDPITPTDLPALAAPEAQGTELPSIRPDISSKSGKGGKGTTSQSMSTLSGKGSSSTGKGSSSSWSYGKGKGQSNLSGGNNTVVGGVNPTSSGKAKASYVSKVSVGSGKGKGRVSQNTVLTDAAASGNIFLRETATTKRQQAVY